MSEIKLDVTKAQLAEEVLTYLHEQNLLDSELYPGHDAWSDVVLDVQDIFSNHWDEPEIEEAE